MIKVSLTAATARIGPITIESFPPNTIKPDDFCPIGAPTTYPPKNDLPHFLPPKGIKII